jgi:putative zinc finger protein
MRSVVRCPVRRSLGAYVLGALEAPEHDDVARHVAGCDGCRRELERIAPLPALLADVSRREVEWLAATAPPAPARPRPAVALLCVALLLILAAGVQLGREALRDPAPPVTASGWNPSTDVRMAASVAGDSWGARLELELSGVAPGERCRLVVRAADGRTEVVSRWRVTYTGRVAVRATTSIPARDVSELWVVTDRGRRLMRMPIPSI